MGRKPKLYIPLTVGFLDDDRIIAASDGPTLLYIAMLLKCKALGTDGRLSEAQVGRLHRPRWKAELKRLAELELVLWDEETEDWFVAAWFSHNDAISVIEERRAADRKRKTDSARNPSGNAPDSALKGSREEKRDLGNPTGTHAFADDGSGSCATCGTAPTNRKHLRVVS